MCTRRRSCLAPAGWGAPTSARASVNSPSPLTPDPSPLKGRSCQSGPAPLRPSPLTPLPCRGEGADPVQRASPLTPLPKGRGDDPGQRHCPRGGVGADTVAVGSRQDLVDGVAYAGELGVEGLARPAQLLEAAAVEHAPGVDHEIGRVGDAALAQAVAVLGRLELVVGPTGDHTAAQ